MSRKRISDKCIVIPAAGASTRLGRPKQLVKYKGQTLIRRAVLAAVEVSEMVVVVLGADFDKIGQEIEDLPVIVTVNERWKLGIGSSISHGLETALDSFPDIRGIMIHLADLPLVKAEHLSLLFEPAEFEGIGIVYSDYGDIDGIPAYFSREYFDQVLGLEGDEGAKTIVRASEIKKKKGVPLGLEYFDVDTPEDILRLDRLY